MLYIEYANMSVYNTTIYFIYFKIVYREDDMFRPSLGHPQALYLCSLASVFFEDLRMTQRRSKHVAMTIYYFEVYEIDCCVID